LILHKAAFPFVLGGKSDTNQTTCIADKISFAIVYVLYESFAIYVA